MKTIDTDKPRKLPRQARSQATVAIILEAATRILTDRGIDAFNTNEVARRAGVSVGSIYQYFPNKDSLLLALRDRHSVEMADAIEGVASASLGGDLQADLQRLVRAAMAAHEADPGLHKVLDQHVAFAHDDHASGQRIGQMVATLLGQNEGEIMHCDLELAAWTTMRTVEALVHAAVLDPPAGFEKSQIEQNIVDVLYSFLTASRRHTADCHPGAGRT